MYSFALDLVFGIYRLVLSPVIHQLSSLTIGGHVGCRFTPSCSQYAREALARHGLVRGAVVSFRRICHCHPFAKAGDDPVPHAIGTSERCSNGP